MTTVDELREDLERLLTAAERWLQNLSSAPDLESDGDQIARDVRQMRSMRTRALSAMLNVALVGSQSSGKSFLVSGLQHGLKYVEVEEDDGGVADLYTGILPSASNATTACPSTVVPVRRGPSDPEFKRGLLRVCFAESTAEGWVEIGSDLSPAEVAAYGSGDNLQDRRPEHIGLTVKEIELLLQDPPLAAKLYDLPGAQSPDRSHDAIMRRAWAEADCFIYVTQATSSLSDPELELIRDLHRHHLETGKKVLWVLTGIDRANQRDATTQKLAWRTTQETNNAYLYQHFGHGPYSDATFIGPGFVAVSPAWEAQAAFQEEDGQTRIAGRNRRNSNMESLRALLSGLVDGGAGYRHLVQIADEARLLVKRRHRPVLDQVGAHQLSVSDLADQLAEVRARIRRTEDSADRVSAQLRKSLDRRVRESEQPFGKLADYLHRGLDTLIDSGNLDAEHSNQIEVRQNHVFNQWMTAPSGPAVLWQHALEALSQEGHALLSASLGDEESEFRLVAPEPFDTAGMLGSRPERSPSDLYRMVQTAGATVGLIGPVAGGTAWLMTSLSLATLALPVAAAVAVGAAAVAGAKALKERESVVQRARGERKQAIAGQVLTAQNDFRKVAEQQGLLLIDAVENHIQQYRNRLHATLHQIEARINAPDIVRSRELVDRLTPLNDQGRELISSLMDISDQARSELSHSSTTPGGHRGGH
ncbi:hypothetical protein ACIQI7_05565 [Kitasatospora sp. NPDC092039]|uniref:hypothetical protein n=1 Tax=Kitasatospora sp. NPDC092039 TaxID=3364086 RepID=UPI0037F4913E